MAESPEDRTLEQGVPTKKGRRPSPRIAQLRRTWYFLRRNTLAMIGLGILLTLALIAVYAVSQPIDWEAMPFYCSTDYGPGNAASGYGPPTNTSGGPMSEFFYQQLQGTCGSNIICTYEVTPPPNAAKFCGGLWYKIPYTASSGVSYASVIPPTENLGTLTTGPLPLGALATAIGTSSAFMNLYTGLLRGADWSLTISVTIVGIGAMLGLFVGAVAGFFGGAVDDVLMRIVDIFLSIPIILFVLVLIAVVSTTVHSIGIPGFALGGWHYHGYVLVDQTWTPVATMILGFAAVWWPLYARLVRGQVLVVREQKYIEAARASGARSGRLLFKHIIPNSMYPIFIQFSLDVGTIPLLVGSLAYLGFHLFPTTWFPEWGAIASTSVYDLSSMIGSCNSGPCIIPWWQLLFPGLALFLFAVSVNLLSDGLRDALDPRLRR